MQTAITKEVVECGPGFDLVEFDLGVDLIDKKSCESRIPINADGEPVGGGVIEEERIKSDFLDLMRRAAE